MLKVSTIINYCTNEYRFIKPVIDQALLFSEQVIVPVSNRFFDNSEENRLLLNRTYKENPNALFIEYPFKMELRSKYGPNFPHDVSRWVGLEHLKKEDIDLVLFLDADELVDAEKFKNWLTTPGLEQYDSFRFRTHWYFRDITIRRESWGRTVVMVAKSKLNGLRVFTRKERLAFLIGNILGNIIWKDGDPMIHHFSWVRTKKEMLKKVKTWGHCTNRDWVKLVENEFAGPFKGKEFVKNGNCKIVEPVIKLTINMNEELPESNKQNIKPYKGKNVIYPKKDIFMRRLLKAVGRDVVNGRMSRR